MTSALLLLALGAGGSGAALLGRSAALAERERAQQHVAALQLTTLRLGLTAAAADHATARLVDGREEGELDPDVATQRWRTTYRASTRGLDQLQDGPARLDAVRLHRTVSELGIEGPTRLGPFLTEYTNALLVATQGATTSGGREVAPLEAALAPVNEVIGEIALAQEDFAAAERITGLEDGPGPLADHLVEQGILRVPDAVAGTPRGVVPRQITFGGLTRERVWERLADLREADPALAGDVLDVLEGPDGRLVTSAAGWANQVVYSQQYSARPTTAGAAAAASVRVTDELVAVVDRSLDERTSGLQEEVTSLQTRATALLGVAVGLLLATLLALTWLMHRRRHQERLLRAAADTDPLTGLANRRALQSRAATRFLPDDTGTHAVVALDMDGFKPVNDTYGHAVGDEVLRQVAHRCRDAIGKNGLLARTGGDEFLVVLLDLPPAQAHEVVAATAERVAAAAQRPILLGTLEITVGMSTGAAVRVGTEDLTATTTAADLRLYEAKRARPGRRAEHHTLRVDAGRQSLPAQPDAPSVERRTGSSASGPRD